MSSIFRFMIMAVYMVIPGMLAIGICKFLNDVQNLSDEDLKEYKDITFIHKISPSKYTLPFWEGVVLILTGAVPVVTMFLLNSGRIWYLFIPFLFYMGVLLASAKEDRKNGSFFILPVYAITPVVFSGLLVPVFHKYYYGILPYPVEYVLIIVLLFIFLFGGLAKGDAYLFFLGYASLLPLYKGLALFVFLGMVLIASIIGLVDHIRYKLGGGTTKKKLPFTTPILIGFVGSILFFEVLPYMMA